MPDTEPPIWHRKWFQALLVALVAMLVLVLAVPPLLGLLYLLRPILLPVLVGLVLAYVLTPPARWLERRCRVPRPVSAAALLVSVLLAVVGGLIWFGPRLVDQAASLVGNLPEYLRRIAESFDLDIEQMIGRLDTEVRELILTTDPDGRVTLDFQGLGQLAWQWLDVGFGVVGTTVGYATYFLVASIVVCFCFCFFFFLWRFDRMLAWFVPLIPSWHRAEVLDILAKMDRAVSAFIRGRVVQAGVVAVVLSTGWWFVGVPYWLVLGLVGGVLNLVPFAVAITWPVAVALAWLESASGSPGAATGFDLWGVVIWPSAVYLFAQALDNWVVEPVVQGQATNMDPLGVLLAVLVGGLLAGLLGMLIAIPLAACGRILAVEVLLPRIRRWAAGPAPPNGRPQNADQKTRPAAR
ncbi:MAG: AI-2E family transporter [Phycisphaeraceae bacterium]